MHLNVNRFTTADPPVNILDMPDIPTLKDIARKLALSVPTVSQGLRNAGNISKATCKRIQAAALEMGYRPNPLAAALRQGSHKSFLQHGMPLAILRMPLRFDSTKPMTKQSLYPLTQITNGIVRRAGELGYRVETFTLQSPNDLSRQLKVLYAQGFQGVFLPPIGATVQIQALEWDSFSVIACGRYDQPSPFHSVRQEIFEDSRYLYNQVILRGYRRICVVMHRHNPKLLDDFAREASVGACRTPGGRKSNPLFLQVDENTPELATLVKKEKVDAVVAFSLGNYYDLRNAGIKIPAEVGYASLHVADEARENAMLFSGLIPPYDHIGVAAVNRMDAMIRHHERGIPPVREQTVIQSQWQEGSTLPFRR